MYLYDCLQVSVQNFLCFPINGFEHFKHKREDEGVLPKPSPCVILQRLGVVYQVGTYSKLNASSHTHNETYVFATV